MDMTKIHDASILEWTLAGYVPFEWELRECKEIGVVARPDIETVPAKVPGSVQKALLDAGKIPDWNIGMNARQIEWIENREWLYEAMLPDDWFESRKRYRIRCGGLDHKGQIFLNGTCIYRFENCHLEHLAELTSHLKPKDNRLQILFECPPRWLGQFQKSKNIRDWKPRFYYTWDWTSRMVQIGIWNSITIEQIPEYEIQDLFVQTDFDADAGSGDLCITGRLSADAGLVLNVLLASNQKPVYAETISSSEFSKNGLKWEKLPVQSWWPNCHGSQPLYDLRIQIVDKTGKILDVWEKRIGFKNVQWRPCENAPAAADPWICAVNGKPIFLQGINWTPIRPNFADIQTEDYRKRLELYKSMGINLLRVWGGAVLERTSFYDLCDQLGLMVWQEMPLSSSGIENTPPDDEEIVKQYLEITYSYICRRHHHASLLLWSGGNELTTPGGVPLGLNHPMFKGAEEIVRKHDPQHRFLPTSPQGPRFMADPHGFGQGQHWDVHGPWKVIGALDEKWETYWRSDDALFRAEFGAPGPMSAEMIRKYSGDCDVMPANENPYWQRTGWWLEVDQFVREYGRKPETLEEYVQWGQQRQTTILTKAVQTCKARFPKCGGIQLWMGHDSYPCTANTSIIDFEGNPKPCVRALTNIYRQ